METRVAGARGLLLVLAAVVLLRVPFLNQAIQGDDPTYLAMAEHALMEPLHPAHAMYVFQGDLVDLRGHPHPPLNALCQPSICKKCGYQNLCFEKNFISPHALSTL